MKNFLFLLVILFITFIDSKVYSAKPLSVDSRIKTYIYNENSVYELVVNYGYQAYIKFPKNEIVETVYLGDRTPWKFKKIKNLLFLAPNDGYSHTNMTIITNKRNYEFDLSSKLPKRNSDNKLKVSNQGDYIIRFYYPDENIDKSYLAKNDTLNLDSNENLDQMVRGASNHNYNYTYSGARQLLPSLIYDDGKNTYIKFSENMMYLPNLSFVNKTNDVIPIKDYEFIDDMIVLKGVYSKLFFVDNKNTICLFNEQYALLSN